MPLPKDCEADVSGEPFVGANRGIVSCLWIIQCGEELGIDRKKLLQCSSVKFTKNSYYYSYQQFWYINEANELFSIVLTN